MTYDEMSVIKEQIVTPAYVFDKVEFKTRTIETRKLLDFNVGMCFSIKANPFLIDSVFQSTDLFDRFEVCSIGELYICINFCIPADKIIFSGVNKNVGEIEEAYEYGVRLFTIESFNHLRDICSVARKKDTVIPVLLRISADSQFGMDEADVRNVICDREQYPNVDIVGIHYFTGTQKKSYGIILEELEYLYKFCERMKLEFGFNIKEVEYGTGLGVDYFVDHKGGANSIKEILPGLQSLSMITKLTIEMGRYFTATCGYYFTKVVDCKTNNGTKYVIVDGGMNHLHYDGQVKSMRVPIHTHIKGIVKERATFNDKWTVCGSICSTEDVICRDVEYNGITEGDFLVFENCGAYSCMEAMSTFLSREMPQIWARLEEDKLFLIRDFIYTDSFNCRMI